MLRVGPRPSLLTLVAVLVGAAILLWDGGESGEGDEGVAPGDGAGAVGVTVSDVIDGDTARMRFPGGEEESVRYIGIDTPEVDPSIGVECFGAEASAENRRLVEGRQVRLVYDAELRDRYGRLLAYIYLGERLINAELVEGGFARTLEIPPNTSQAPRLNRLEQEAGEAGRGLWSAC